MKSTTNKSTSLGWILVIFGLVCLIAEIGPITKDLSIYSWSQADAKVTSTQIVQTYGHTTLPTLVYDPVITYQYTALGKTYSSNSFSVYQDGSTDKSVTQTIIDEYPVNKTITIYYNPKNPAEAYIEHAVSWPDFVFAGALVLIIILGLLLIKKGRKKSL